MTPQHVTLITLGVGDLERSRADIDTTYADAIAAGGTPLARPSDMSWGEYSSYFADPVGQVWKLGHNLFWPFNDAGSLTVPTDAD